MSQLKSKIVKGTYRDLKGELEVRLFESSGSYNVTVKDKSRFFGMEHTHSTHNDLSSATNSYQQVISLINT